MTFYFKPPRGLIEIDKMVKCVQQRLEFITSVADSDDGDFEAPHNISYFVEGTAIDRASHYLLRLASLRLHSFRSHVQQAETVLFHHRLNRLNHQHLITLLKTCRQHSEELSMTRKGLDTKYYHFLQSINNLCQDFLRKPGGLEHILKSVIHNTSCRAMFIRVPYRTCLKLVAERKVELRNGEAHVPCCAWKKLLVEVFHLHLQYGYEDMQSSGCHRDVLRDARMLQLSKLLESKYKKLVERPHSVGREVLTCEKVWKHRLMFPPCIISLLDTLNKHHRLGHHARIALTLFLKEAGMPVEQALEFWRSQYSVPGCKHGPSCSHTWQKDERKFTYSVRHMYGLEGGCKNYAAASCATMQGQLLAPGAVGGCPFNRYPESKLLPLLSPTETEPHEAMMADQGRKENSPLTSAYRDILDLANKDKPSQACQRLLQARIRSSSAQHNVTCKISKPSEFYSVCRDWSEQF